MVRTCSSTSPRCLRGPPTCGRGTRVDFSVADGRKGKQALAVTILDTPPSVVKAGVVPRRTWRSSWKMSSRPSTACPTSSGGPLPRRRQGPAHRSGPARRRRRPGRLTPEPVGAPWSALASIRAALLTPRWAGRGPPLASIRAARYHPRRAAVVRLGFDTRCELLTPRRVGSVRRTRGGCCRGLNSAGECRRRRVSKPAQVGLNRVGWWAGGYGSEGGLGFDTTLRVYHPAAGRGSALITRGRVGLFCCRPRRAGGLAVRPDWAPAR